MVFVPAALASACAPVLSAGTAAAQEPAQPMVTEQTVTTTAVGRVERAPDRAVLRVAVETFAETAEEAADQNAERTEAVLAALERLGIPEDHIRTTSYQVNPEYDYSPGEPRRPGEQRLVGYRVVNMVQVTIDDIDRVGEIIDAAISAGANRIGGLSFQLRDPAAARQDAIREAVALARADAQAVADALGRRLGPALSVSTTGGAVPPPVPMMRLESRALDAAAAAAPIQPGELEVVAGVTAVFRLDPPR